MTARRAVAIALAGLAVGAAVPVAVTYVRAVLASGRPR